MGIIKGYIFGIGYAFACLLLSLIIYKAGAPKKVTRKLVHILVGFEWIILYHYMGAGVHFLAVCLFFLVLLAIAYFGKLMPMIASENDNAPGTVYYAVAMTGVATVGCFVPSVMLPFGVGIYCTSIGDGFAGLVGQYVKKCNPRIYGKKTLLGTISNFSASFISTCVMNHAFGMGMRLWQMISIGVLSAGLELVTAFGLDNVTVTWGVTALTYAFIHWPSIGNYVIPIVLTPLVICFAVQRKALSRSGIAAAIVLDLLLTVSLGNFGFLVMASFFFGAILIDKFKKRILMQGRKDEAEKGSCRDHMQVLANGLVGCICAVIYFISSDHVFLVAFVASFAEALADTAGSGFGVAARKVFDPFRMKRIEGGLSGGMSFVGTVASLIASYVVAMVAFSFGVVSLLDVMLITLFGFLGSVFDSFLGSVIQCKYQCSVCGKITERAEHCGERTRRYSGLSFIDNDCVNILGCLFASVGISLLYTFI